MIGVINLLKEPGYTSHDVVAKLRRLLGMGRIGHGGTLDPGAAGVLPILVGRATKLMPYLVERPKSYRAEMTLGIATDTQDAAGKTVSVNTDFSIAPTRLGDVLAGFLGNIEQIPPMASAVQVKGKRLYELSRAGKEIPREPRPVVIHELHVVAIFPKDTQILTAGTRILFDVVCSKGTYIRTLIHDIGEKLGCGAHMSFLVRTGVGPFELARSHTFDEIAQAVRSNRLREVLQEADDAVDHLPEIVVSPADVFRLRQGQPLLLPSTSIPSRAGQDFPPTVRVKEPEEGLICIGHWEERKKTLRPIRVL